MALANETIKSVKPFLFLLKLWNKSIFSDSYKCKTSAKNNLDSFNFILLKMLASSQKLLINSLETKSISGNFIVAQSPTTVPMDTIGFSCHFSAIVSSRNLMTLGSSTTVASTLLVDNDVGGKILLLKLLLL